MSLAGSPSAGSSRSAASRSRDRDWNLLRDHWQETLTAHGWPVDREVKWHGIRTGEVPPALARRPGARPLAAPLLRHAARHRARLAGRAGVLRKRRGHLRHGSDVPGGAVRAAPRGRRRRWPDRRRQPLSRGRRASPTVLRRPHQGRQPLLAPRPHRRGAVPRPRLLDRPSVRGSRLRDHGRRRARQRSGARLPEDAPPPLRHPSGDGCARRRRDQALPRAGATAARGDAPLPAAQASAARTDSSGPSKRTSSRSAAGAAATSRPGCRSRRAP